MKDYNPDKQVYLCPNKELCLFGNSPTLAELNRDYGEQASLAWLIPQLTDIAIFSNCQKILNEQQIRTCAKYITAEYYYLKVTELMLYFYGFKLGKYGKFYGTVDPMTILSSLRYFITERNEAIIAHDNRIAEERYKREAKKAITYEEYLRRKNNNQ